MKNPLYDQALIDGDDGSIIAVIQKEYCDITYETFFIRAVQDHYCENVVRVKETPSGYEVTMLDDSCNESVREIGAEVVTLYA